MAENEPPLSVQTSNQKTDGLDIDNDKGEKKANVAQIPMITSDMEEGEILSTDEETVDGLNEIRKQLEQELSKDENIGALKEDVDMEDLLDVKKATATSNELGINFGLLAECKKVNTDKTSSNKKSESSYQGGKSHNKDSRDNRSRSESHDSRRDRDRKKSNDRGSSVSDRDKRKGNEKSNNSKEDRNRDRRKSNERTPSKGDNSRDWGRKSGNDKFNDKGNSGRDSNRYNDRSGGRDMGSGSRNRHDRGNDRGNRNREQRSTNERGNALGKGKPNDTSKKQNNHGNRNNQNDTKKMSPKSSSDEKSDLFKCPFKQTNEKDGASKNRQENAENDIDELNKSTDKVETVEETDSDKIEEVLDNLEEMTCSSSSENEKLSKTDGEVSKDIPATVKRKHSIENVNIEQNQESVEPPNKKTKVVEEENEDSLDETRTFPSAQEFQIIDDIGNDEQEMEEKESENEEVAVNNDGGDNVDDGEYVSSEDDLDDNEIYSWLEDGINKKTISKEIDYLNLEPVDMKEKFVLVERGIDPFEVLPEGWVCVTHNSGMPTYLHKATRVVTLSKPYFLGSGSVRRHDIPLSAIPCLQYRKQIQKEKDNSVNINGRNSNCQGSKTPVTQNEQPVIVGESSVQNQTDIDDTGASQNKQTLMNGELSGSETVRTKGEQNVTSQNKQPEESREVQSTETKSNEFDEMLPMETNQSVENGTYSFTNLLLPNNETNQFEVIRDNQNVHSNSKGELTDSGVLDSTPLSEDKTGCQNDTQKIDQDIGEALEATSSPVIENGIYEAVPLETSVGKDISGDESSEQKESSQDDTTDLDKTLTFEEKGDDSSCLDTTKTEGEKTPDGQMPGPPVKIESVAEKKIENSVSAEELQDYCKSLFEFKTVTVKKFKTWRERRKHLNAIRRKKSRPALPSKTKLITCEIPVPKDSGSEKPKKKEFVLNPAGKSPVCILHEYAQHTLKIQPRYRFLELENAQNPYSAIVLINNVEYGKGFASSKKLAKMNAAKETLRILIPGMTKIWDEDDDMEDMSFFDEIKVEDPRVSDLCTKTGQPSPYQILLECLKRNYGMGDTHVKTDVKPLKHQKSEYTLNVGKHSVTIVCKNKREGKQRAAQAMLQQLHPHINCIGSLLRLYGQSFGRELKEKKKEEESVTELQTHTQANRPNIALLDKLRKEMSKLQAQRTAVTSKGSLLIDKVPTGITSLDL